MHTDAQRITRTQRGVWKVRLFMKGFEKYQKSYFMPPEDCYEWVKKDVYKRQQIGWLKLGGYRIGIRSKQGYYVYYAHLQQYAPDLRLSLIHI